MRSLKRIANRVLKIRVNSGSVGAIAAGVFAVSTSVAMMNDLLDRWDLADQASLASGAGTALAKPDTVRILASVANVKDAFSNAGYELDAVRRGQIAVPRVRLASLPYDLPQMQQAQDRKAVFLRYMLPYVLEANHRVRQQRARILSLRPKIEKAQRLGEEESVWLAALYEEYRVEPGDFAALSLRIDTVPVSLALAQAAVESGWGTSRFAQEGNAAFGQWTSQDYAGLVPRNRDENRTHKVRSFDSLKASAESYLRNLNTHRAYRAFRKMRKTYRNDGKPIDSVAIAGTLLSYSEKGAGYVKLLRHIIEKNDLRTLDGAQLGEAVLEFRPDA